MRSTAITLAGSLLLVLTSVGCPPPPKELPAGAGYQAETSGVCDDGDATNGGPTKYIISDPSRSCADGTTLAFSMPVSFQQLIGSAHAQIGGHTTSSTTASSQNKAISTFQVTQNEQLTCTLNTQISAHVTGGGGTARVFVWLFDNNGRAVPGTNTQLVYKVGPNAANPTTQLDVSLNGAVVKTIANPGNYPADSQPQWTVNLTPGTYKVNLELNVDSKADPLAAMLVTSTAEFK